MGSAGNVRHQAALKAWETRRFLRAASMDPEDWQREEEMADRRRETRRLRSIVLRLGGIRDLDYRAEIPWWLVRKAGAGLDVILDDLQGYGFWINTPERLIDLLKGA